MANTEIRLFIFFAAKDGELLTVSKNKTQKLIIAKFRLKLKKVGKTTRPFRYDLNQVPYNYTGPCSVPVTGFPWWLRW